MSARVMVVDDVKYVRDTISRVLTANHYQIVGEAKNGEEAIEMYMRLRPDIITMDVVMPQMSGIEAARQILKADRDGLVVMISALGQEHLVMEAINVGVKDYIIKPFTDTELLKTIAHVLGTNDTTHKSAG